MITIRKKSDLEGSEGLDIGSIKVQQEALITTTSDNKQYKRWKVRIHLDKGKIWDVHIKFTPIPAINVVDNVLGDAPTSNKIDMNQGGSNHLPIGWTGDYNPSTGEITLQAPNAPAPDTSGGLDPAAGFGNPYAPSDADFSFDFDPVDPAPGTTLPGKTPGTDRTTTVSYSHSDKSDIASGSGQLL
jgi:hypothetical protein